MSIKLTDTQLVMLSAAAQREDRCLVAQSTLKGAAAQKVARKLITAGLAKEIRTKSNDPIWRRNEESGASYTLRLTTAGAKAIGIYDSVEPENALNEDSAADGDETSVTSKFETRDAPFEEAMARVPARPSAPRSGSKLAHVIKLLQRRDGASITELIDATDWLAHTTRAALTGLRKRGYAVVIDRSERGSFYRIEADLSVGDRPRVARSLKERAKSRRERARHF